MRNIILIMTITNFFFACSDNQSGNHDGEHKHDSSSSIALADTSKKSIPSQTKKRIGNTSITISYYSPGVRGRVIWGGLVPYNEVWVTGAHSATKLEVDNDFKMGGRSIPAGKYAVFTIPGKDEWTVVINKNWDQHLADEYTEADDIVRLKVKPEVRNEISERLKYEIEKTGEQTANIIISWEKLRVTFGIEVQ